MFSYIKIGQLDSPLFQFDETEISAVTIDTAVDVIGRELSSDALEIEVYFDDTNEHLRGLDWATPVYYYNDSELSGKFYITKVIRIGAKKYRILATSAVGIMEYETYYGGLYNGKTFQWVAERILSTNGLMPYKGVYTEVIRGNVNEAATDPLIQRRYLTGQGLGSYSCVTGQYHYPPPRDNCNVYGTATMSSKVHTKVTINGGIRSLMPDDDPFNLKNRQPIWGAMYNQWYSDLTDDKNKYNYGCIMELSRTSTSEPYPTFGEVIFSYGKTFISLGTPTEPTTYEFDIDPVAETAVINGVTYSINYDLSVANAKAPLHVYAGGHKYTITSGYYSDLPYISSGDVSDGHGGYNSTWENCISCDYYEHIVTSQNGTVQFDAVSVYDIDKDTVGYLDLKSFRMRQDIGESTVVESSATSYDGRYGDFPLLERRTAFQEDVMGSVRFLPVLSSMLVYGWIPVCSKRDALHQLMLANGVTLIKGDDGSLLFTIIDNDLDGSIDRENTFDVGSVEKLENTNTLELTEHTFELDTTQTPVTVFENTISSASGYYVAELAQAPVYNAVSESGISVVYASTNACVVSGTGKISAIPYNHSESKMSRTIGAYPDGRTVTLSGDTMITHQNAAKVLDRMEAYYTNAKIIKVDIKSAGEFCGRKYSLLNAFGELASGFLSRMVKTVSSFARASCEFISGYIVPASSGGYNNYVLLTGSGTWNVPQSVLDSDNPTIYAVLIGGGQGGSSGFAGENGKQMQQYDTGYRSERGAGGTAGTGGKIYEIQINNPASSYTYNCGLGGSGGAISYSHSSNNQGLSGGNTTMTGGGSTYSSASGMSLPNGYLNLLTGDIYAGVFCSVPWGEEEHLDPSGWSYVRTGYGGKGGTKWVSNGTFNSWGATASYAVIPEPTLFYGGNWPYRHEGVRLYIGEGAPGGGGYGSYGGIGTDASKVGNTYYAGNGGNGGNATLIPPKPTEYNPKYFGYGGHPGGGGGGGGSSGWIDWAGGVPGTPGTGGYGGKGGDGGDGCILIYY